MGLGLAGAVSGLGQGLQQGLQTLNSGIVQMGVQGTLNAEERAWQEKKLALQQQFEKGLQQEKMAADRQNTLDQIAAQGKNALELEGARGKTQKEIHEMDNTAADLRLDKQLHNHETIEKMKLAVTKDIHDKDRDMLADRYKKLYSLEERKLAVDKGKMHTIATGDGRIALMSPDGKAHGYLTDGKGNEIRAATDLPKTAQVEINSLVDELHDLTREYVKNPMHTEAERDEYKTAKSQIRDRINEVVEQYATGKPTHEPPPKKKGVIPEEYKNLVPGAGQGTVLAPGQTPQTQPSRGKGMIEQAFPFPFVMDKYLRKGQQ